MSAENSPFNNENNALQLDMLNHAKLEILRNNDRVNFSLAEFATGATYFMETYHGLIEFTTYPIGLEESIEAGRTVYAKINNPDNGLISSAEIMIFGASEEETMIQEKLGTIEQYADFVYAPLYLGPIWDGDYSLSESDYQQKIANGDIVQTSVGHFRRERGGYEVISSVLDLVVIDSSGMCEEIFVHQD